jgi:hypothetical protein
VNAIVVPKTFLGRGLSMTKFRNWTMGIAITSAILTNGIAAYAVAPGPVATTDTTQRTLTGNQAGMLANPGVYGTSGLSGTGTVTNRPQTGTTYDTGSRTGLGAGIGANIGGLGVGIGGQVGGTGSNGGVTDPTRNYNNQMMDRMSTRGTGITGGTSNYNTTPVRNYAANSTANRNMSWGWLGLLGLFGLAGVRGNNRSQTRNEANR